MATHSSTLAWKIPWTEDLVGLVTMGSRRVGHDWVTALSLFIFMHWRRKWQPTPVFLPGESQGWEPGGLLSMGSHRVGHDWCNLAAAIAKRYAYRLNIWAFLLIFLYSVIKFSTTGVPRWLSGKKNLSASQETWVWSLGGEDPLEKEIATHSFQYSAWEILWTEELGGLQSRGLQKNQTHLATRQVFYKTLLYTF